MTNIEKDKSATSKTTPSRKTNPLVTEMTDWAKSIGIAVFVAVILKATVIQSYVITTGSMIPTIVPQERVFGNRVVYHIHKPERGDIIAFTPPQKALRMAGETRPIPFVKRVIAVEGDILSIRDGVVYRNGTPLNEPYIEAPPVEDLNPVKVPSNTVFVMGDNRPNSLDSRMWDPLPVSNVQAKAFFRFWPLNRVGIVH